MGLARFIGRVGPPVVLLLPAMMLTAALPAPFVAAPLAPARVDCKSVTPSAAARSALTASGGTPASASVRGQLNTLGELVGRNLTAQSGSSAPLSVTLPTESFVGRPSGDVVVYTRYAPTTGSEVRALNPQTRCDVRLAAPAEIVRSAVLDKTATAVFVHGVTRSTRSDAGVMRFELQSGASSQVVAPLQLSDELGPIFGTDLRWSVDGNALAVQSCGFSSCLTRVLHLWTGAVSEYAAPDQGGFIGLSEDHLVTYAACGGRPCDVLSTDLHTGEVLLLAHDAIDVQSTSAGSAVSLTIQTAAGQIEVVQ
jgi:hypothetical protein